MDDPNRRKTKHRHTLKLKELLARGYDEHRAGLVVLHRMIAQRPWWETETHRRAAVHRHVGMIMRAVNNTIGAA